MTIEFADTAKPGADVFHGEIADIGYLGKWTTFKVSTAGGLRFSVSQANDRRFVERPFTWGDKVVLSFAPDAAVLLTK